MEAPGKKYAYTKSILPNSVHPPLPLSQRDVMTKFLNTVPFGSSVERGLPALKKVVAVVTMSHAHNKPKKIKHLYKI